MMEKLKLHLIMPMGGSGSRFAKAGYNLPKPLLMLHGRPFFYWSVRSLEKFIHSLDITFVVLKQHIDQYQIDDSILTYFPKAKIISVDSGEVAAGPLMTCLKGVEDIHDDVPVMMNDCDHMFRCQVMSFVIDNSRFSRDGALLTFTSSLPQYSYISYSDSGTIIGTVEKQVVSSDAICGAYLFKNANVFREVANTYIKDCEYSELFLSGVFNTMCKEGLQIEHYPADFHVSFGTPEEYVAAKSSLYFSELL